MFERSRTSTWRGLEGNAPFVVECHSIGGRGGGDAVIITAIEGCPRVRFSCLSVEGSVRNECNQVNKVSRYRPQVALH